MFWPFLILSKQIVFLEEDYLNFDLRQSLFGMNLLVTLDKFKGSISAEDACTTLSKGIQSALPDAKMDIQPMADGGEGSLAILSKILPMHIKSIKVVDALFRPIFVQYGILHEEAFIETSASCGLHLLNQQERNPRYTSTYGVGMIIKDAIDQGCSVIHLFLGGSATNDGGIGMANALGYNFLDKNNHHIHPIGQNMLDIDKIIKTKNTALLSSIQFHTWSDVQVSLTGPGGATELFAKQKGASDEDILVLEKGMVHLKTILSINFHFNETQNIGASGGLAAGSVAFLNAKAGSGITFMMKKTGIAHKIAHSDIVITGEGMIDHQSVKGKVIYGIAKLCQLYKKKLIFVAGEITLNSSQLDELGVSTTYSIVDYSQSKEDALNNVKIHLTQIGEDIGRQINM